MKKEPRTDINPIEHGKLKIKLSYQYIVASLSEAQTAKEPVKME